MRIECRTLLKVLGTAIAAAWIGAIPLASPAGAAEKVTIFAAASLKNALDAVNAEWTKEAGKETTVSYAASSALARQIEAGAPADVFISADLAWMDYAGERKLIRPETRADLLGNRIVLVTGNPAAAPVEIEPGFDLKGLLGDEKLAMGAVDTVPAGKYGKAALEKLDVWSSVEKNIAGAENVRAALLLVAKGEAPYGIVYQTDAAADQNVKIVGTFPQDSHPPIVYPIAITAGSSNPDAAAYLDFVTSAKAAALFEAQGFAFLK